MIELNRHIEILLLTNECVIVPDFGGFMTHYIPARYDAADHSYLPPLRTLGFNPQLCMNDSVLVQSYVEAYDISYPEALRRVSAEVNELKQILSEEGSYTLTDLGTLTVNADGNYEFAPCEAGLLTPELYGLGAYTIKQLKEEKIEVSTLQTVSSAATEVSLSQPEESVPSEQPTLLEFTEENDDHEAAIRIRLSWIRNAVAIAASIAAFFMMSTPVVNSDLGSNAMSQIQNNILYKLMPKDTNTIPAEPVVEPVANKAQTSTDSVETIIPAAPTITYYIVVASQVKRSNAENYVEKLRQQGYEDAKVLIHKNVVRVSCGEYDSESEAYSHLRKLSSNEEFADAWIYKSTEV